jgi:hypothetical protein
LIVGHVFHAPTGDAAAALRLDFNRAGIVRSRNPGDERISIDRFVVDRFEAFDDFPTVDRFDPAG